MLDSDRLKSGMAQSLSRVVIHVVFSTKNRAPVLTVPLRSELCAYIAGVLQGDNHTPIRIGGHDDHIHALYGLSRTMTIADSIKNMKTAATMWLREKDARFDSFSWQGGYAAFSVSESDVHGVVRYIDNQDEHHRKVSFQDELRQLLESHKVKYDERYLWD